MDKKYKEDYQFIRAVCDAIQGRDVEKKNRLLNILYIRYHEIIHNFIAKLLWLYSNTHLNETERTKLKDIEGDIENDFLVAILSDESRILSNYEGNSSFKTYLYSVVKNFLKQRIIEMVSLLRRESIPIDNLCYSTEDFNEKDDTIECLSLKLAHLPETRMVTYVDENPEENIIQKEKEINDNIKKQALAAAILQLSFYYPDDARHIIMDLCGLKRKDIAAKLDIAVNTLNKRLTRSPYGAYEKLKKIIRAILLKDYKIDVDCM